MIPESGTSKKAPRHDTSEDESRHGTSDSALWNVPQTVH